MPASRKDRGLLRDLGRRVAEIAALPVQQEKLRLWKALNGLKPVRPMVMIDQVCWHEMDVDGELKLRAGTEFLRGIEADLRRRLYRWKHLPSDAVVEPAVDVAKFIRGADFGIGAIEEKAVTDAMNDVYSHHYIDQLAREEDVEKIRDPEVTLDEKATAKAEETARGIFDGILEVRMHGPFPMFALWDRLAEWRSVEKALLDLIDRPEHIHRIMSRLTAAYMSLLEQLESQGLLGGAQPTIHCTGAFTDELPAPGYDPRKVRAKDLWTCGMAQMFSTVSPEMHQEFELDYAREWYSRFGLVYYGCCEPLHKKLDIVRKVPHLRKISMSPWVDQEEAAAQMGRDFVFSRKPNPAFLAADTWSPEAVERDLRETVDICARHGCPVELILKDISTVRYEPRRLWEWAKIARSVVGDHAVA